MNPSWIPQVGIREIWPTGTVIKGDFVIERKLGAGGFGSAYLAQHRYLGTKHVIKRLHEQYASDTQYVKKFLSEAQLLARLKGHPNIVEVQHMTQIEDGHLILVMEYIGGGDLAKLMEKRQLTPTEVIFYGWQIANALHAAHAERLIHRDVKPDNVMLGRDSQGNEVCKLIDFGIAADQMSLQQTSVMRPASVGYAAPEQLSRAGKYLDGRADLYSLGASMYRMLCGRMPYPANDVFEWFDLVRQGLPPAPSELRADVPEALSTLLLEMLSPAPERRPESAAEVMRRLTLISEQHTSPARLEAKLDSLKRNNPQLAARYVDLAVTIENSVIPVLMQRAVWGVNEAEARAASQVLVMFGFAHSSDVDGGIRLDDAQLRLIRAQFPDLEALALIHSATRLSALITEQKPQQYVPQMIGRLMIHSERRVIQDFIQRLKRGGPAPALLPLWPSLEPAGTPLVRILHPEWAFGVELTADGKKAVFASIQGVSVWDLESGRELWTRDDIVGRTVTAGNQVVGILNSELKVWDLLTGHELWVLVGHSKCVNAVAVTADGKRAVSASDDNLLKVWDLQTGQELQTLSGHTDGVRGVLVTADNKRVVSWSRDKSIKVWDLTNGSELLVLTRHPDWINSVALTPDGKRVISAFRDKSLKVWDIETGSELQALADTGVDQIVASGTSRVVSSSDSMLNLLDVETGQNLRTLCRFSNRVPSLASTPDGKRVVSVTHDKAMVLDFEKARESPTLLSGQAEMVKAVAVTANGKQAVSVSSDNSLNVWDLENGRHLWKLDSHASPVNCVVIAAGGKRALSTSLHGALKVWDIQTGRLRTLGSLPRRVTAVTLSADGKRAVSGCQNGLIQIWEVESGRQLGTLPDHRSWVQSLAMTPDGQRVIVAASKDGSLGLWDLGEGRCVLRLTGHVSSVLTLVVTADGRRAVSGSADGTIKVWDLDSGNELSTLSHQPEGVMAVAVTVDGKRVISASGRTLRIWDLNAGCEIAEFECDESVLCCAEVGRERYIAGTAGGRLVMVELHNPC